jgi:hypothetical protein
MEDAMLRTILSFLIGGVLSFTIASAQPPDTLWTKTFGGSDVDIGNSVRQTSDGGYIIAGDIYYYSSGYSDVYLIKTDELGRELWQQTYGENNWNYGECVQQTSDGGYIIAGTTYSTYWTGSYNVYLIKTDAVGNELWSQTLGGSSVEYGYSVQQTTDSGYIIAGKTSSYGAGGSDVYLVKTDWLGSELWSSTFGGDSNEEGYSVQQTTDGGYIITGRTSSYTGSWDVYLIKADESGSELWSQTLGGYDSDCGYSVQQSTDSGYIIAGWTSAGAANVYLIKTDISGSEIWSQTFGGGSNDWGCSVQQTSDGGYIITGSTNSFGNYYYNIYMIKTDVLGNETWSQNFGGNSNELGYSGQQTSDGGYIAVGQTESYGAGGVDVYLIRLEPEEGYPAVTISLTPSSTPILIPATGGSFDFNVMATNNEVEPVTFNAWTDITLPDSSIYGPVIGPIELTLPASATIDRDRTQMVPSNAPAGIYTYNAYVGDNLGNVWSEDHFEFEKLLTGDGSLIGEWASYGEEFGEIGGGSTPALRDDYALMGAHPNPFNPTTTISYQLSARSRIHLAVYDLSGRKVTDLINGWRDAGVHEVTFDGSQLPSGVYLYRLKVGNFNVSGKMVLMK